MVSEGVSLPKPLVNICGQPMIGRLIGIFDNLGAERISVIVNEQMTEVAAYLRQLAPELRSRLDLAVKSTPSSMHSFHELGSLLRGHGRFIVTTVDTIFREDDFRRYADAFASASAETEGMMAVTRYIDDEKPLYVDTDERMNIVAFRDEPWAGAKYISGGIYGLDNHAIDVLDKCLENGVSRMRNFQRALVNDGVRLKAYDMGDIIDVDHAGDIEKAKKFVGGGFRL